ncbi:Hypothetical Protein SLY_0666 [Strawberry lethal yellows phytoplasma (CPA) str. NZSb11]|uniref:Uncharacterized protein n=1 Tax=Strawberry lethal yellows phytoplasma (CPA) str. NZSb11 TaxID=980422 RepID=R4RQ13_PHYAS|nr:Hypothetical Protein SLY_0666 [Strawberry lethal yellows phytoplasma (CPA) str. NZSb11]
MDDFQDYFFKHFFFLYKLILFSNLKMIKITNAIQKNNSFFHLENHHFK